MFQRSIHLLITLAFVSLSMAACSPLWYSRHQSSMLAYGSNDLVWNINYLGHDFEPTIRQLLVGVLISNLAKFSGDEEEIANKVLAIPATELRHIADCISLANVEYYQNQRKKQSAVRISWPNSFSCPRSDLNRSNYITILPGEFAFPEMATGKLTSAALDLLIQGVFRLPPPIKTIRITGIYSEEDPDIDLFSGLSYAQAILERNGTTIVQDDPDVPFMQCKYWSQKLDPHSYHRMIYHVSCQIVNPAGELLWQDESSLIPLLP